MNANSTGVVLFAARSVNDGWMSTRARDLTPRLFHHNGGRVKHLIKNYLSLQKLLVFTRRKYLLDRIHEVLKRSSH